MVRAILCREMKWTWQEFDEQPAHFIQVLLAMLQAESEAYRKRNSN